MIKIKFLSTRNVVPEVRVNSYKSIAMGNLIDWGQQNFSLKGQVVNILAFASHMWSLLHILLFKKQSFKNVNHP